MKKQKSFINFCVMAALALNLVTLNIYAQETEKKSNLWEGSTVSTTTNGLLLIRDNANQGFGGKATIHNETNGTGLSLNSYAFDPLKTQINLKMVASAENGATTSMYGINNQVSGNGQVYGQFNSVNSTSINAPVYGFYSVVGGDRENPNKYGIYSEVINGGYAGYFVGDGYFSGSLKSGGLLLGIGGDNQVGLHTGNNGSVKNLNFGNWFQMRSNGSFEFGSTNNKFTLGTSAEGSLKVLTFTPGNQKLFSDGSGLFAGGLKFSTATAGLEIKEITYKGAPALRINRKNLPSEKNFTFLSNGNFEVDGKIFAREVEVMLPPFPDYVFGENYTLMPIEQVEGFIKENGHLPNVPSASSIEENGIGLGQLSVIQMEKIEELTLYLIQLNNRVKQLEQENKELKAAVKISE